MAKRKHNSASDRAPAANLLSDSLAKFKPFLSAAQFSALQEELARPLFPALRANPLKVEPQAALADWAQRYGWEVKPVPFCADGRWVLSSAAPISQPIEHRLGFYYIQDGASMLPVELFDFEPGGAPLILDLAASPGGKTTHLISKTGDRGLVIANDVSSDRLMALRLVLQAWGAVGTAIARFPGEKYGLWFPETFDRVLLDAPCSMQGLRSTEGHRIRSISEHEQSDLARRQTALLESALRAVKTGGQVVYSTCTLSPEEDEAVLDSLLLRHPGAFQVDQIASRLPVAAAGLTAIGEQAFQPQVANAFRIWPHTLGTAGFFAARLTKLTALPRSPQTPPARPFERTGLERLGKREEVDVIRQLAERYGIPAGMVSQEGDFGIWRRAEIYYLVPQLLLNHFPLFPVEDLGLRLAERTPDGLSPAHEWVARWGLHFTAGVVTLPAEQVPAWLRGEDIPGRPSGDLPVTSVAAVKDSTGRLLGRGKIQSGRLKNLLPRRLI
jgi:16S rRNA (cytosine1407-C5)-methyltransferase